MRDSGHRTWHHEYIIVVTSCVLCGDLTAQFVYMSNSASRSVHWKRFISSVYDATSEGIYIFVVDIKSMMVTDSLGAHIWCSFVFYV